MNSFTKLQSLLLILDAKTLSKSLGYANISNFIKARDKIVNSKNLAEFLHKGHYDFLYSSSELVEKLAILFERAVRLLLYNDQKVRLKTLLSISLQISKDKMSRFLFW